MASVFADCVRRLVWLAAAQISSVVSAHCCTESTHTRTSIYQDLVTWWDIVKPGGILFGDDWSWDGVRLAVQRFASENQLSISHRHDKWELRRPASSRASASP